MLSSSLAEIFHHVREREKEREARSVYPKILFLCRFMIFMLTRACQIVMNDASKNMKGYWKTTVIFVISLYWFSYILKKLGIFVCKGKKSGFLVYIYIFAS